MHISARFLPLITVGYACVLVIATHLPPSTFVVGAASKAPDKFWHFVAYAILGFLAYLSDTVLRPRAAHRYMLVGPLLLLFAVCDEVTQPFFGRSAELWDLAYDLFGILTGLIAADFLQRIVQRRFFCAESTSMDR